MSKFKYVIVLLVGGVLCLAGVLYLVSNNKNKNLGEVETTSVSFIETSAYVSDTSKSPEEGDYVNSKVDEVLETLLSQIRSNEFLMYYVGVDSVKADGNLNGGYDIYLVGLSNIGYYQDMVELFSINSDGTYNEYPDIVDLIRYIENVLVQHETAEIDNSIFDEVSLSDKVEGGVEQINKELSLYLEDTEEVYESYILQDIEAGSFILSGISNGIANKLLRCQFTYNNDKVGLLVTRIR